MKLAFLLDSLEVSEDIYDLYTDLVQQKSISSIILIVAERPSVSNFSKLKSLGLKRCSRSLLFKGLELIDQKISQYLSGESYSGACKELDPEIHQVIRVRPNTCSIGLYTRFDENQISKIKELEIDIIVRCCSGILKGEILTTAKYGVISLHHGDNRFYWRWRLNRLDKLGRK